MSNSVDPDETDHEPSHLDLRCLQKPIIIACGSERVNPWPSKMCPVNILIRQRKIKQLLLIRRKLIIVTVTLSESLCQRYFVTVLYRLKKERCLTSLYFSPGIRNANLSKMLC